MTKKIGLACALIHAPRLLVLDEPFEAVDPVSGEGIRSILRGYARSGGTVVGGCLRAGSSASRRLVAAGGGDVVGERDRGYAAACGRVPGAS